VLRAAMLAFSLALIPASASAQSASEQPLPPGWGFIESEGWTLSGEGPDTLVFVMPARQEMHIWVRYEIREPVAGMRSWRDLKQVDCTNWRVRAVSSSRFAESNLVRLVDTVNVPTNWDFPAPETFGEIPLSTLCD
jgi:hypothetical protein